MIALSTWNIDEGEGRISFEIPDEYTEFDVIVEPVLTLEHSEYARDTLNEDREYIENVGLNETSINGQPATMAQYNASSSCVLNCPPMTLTYFMVTDDYTGYRLFYEPDFRDKNWNSSERLSTIERMASSFRITK